MRRAQKEDKEEYDQFKDRRKRELKRKKSFHALVADSPAARQLQDSALRHFNDMSHEQSSAHHRWTPSETTLACDSACEWRRQSRETRL